MSNDRFQRLEKFFKAMVKLTIQHDVVGNDIASVSPSKIGKELDKVDPDWYKTDPGLWTTEDKK